MALEKSKIPTYVFGSGLKDGVDESKRAPRTSEVAIHWDSQLRFKRGHEREQIETVWRFCTTNVHPQRWTGTAI